jgi:hypothetical protein
MKAHFQSIAIFTGLLIAMGVAWIYRPYEKPNMDKVHPRVRDLKEPLLTLQVGFYLDGGSISLRIVDAGGTKLNIAMPVWGDGKEYGEVYFDTLYHKPDAMGMKVESPSQTVLRLQELLRQQRPYDHMTDLGLAKLSGRSRDDIRFFIHLIARKLKHQTAETETEHDSVPNASTHW